MRPPPADRRKAWTQLGVVLLVATLVRLYLAPRYYGWEEGDYGNLMMIREVIDSRFTWFRTAHMPGWYSLGAVARLLFGGERWPALAMTMAFSVGSVGLATALARRLSGVGAAWLVGLWLATQPEMSLYGASTLRSPVFTCLGLLGLVLLVRGRESGHAVTAAAFLVRMEAFFVFYVPSLFTWGPDGGRRWRRLLPGAVILATVVGSWQLYITVGLGEAEPFFAGPMSQNSRLDEMGVHAFAASGLASAWHLLTWTLPRKVSWTALALAALGLVAVLRGTGRPGGRAVAGYGAFTVGFWLSEGFLAQHDANHNLYWVWLLPALPPLILLAGLGWAWLDERLVHLPRAARAGVLSLTILSAAPSFIHETRYQMHRSEAWYRPQLELSRWLEAHARPGAGMILGSIPEVWVQRRDHAFRVTSWWFLPPSLRGQPAAAVGHFFVDQRVDYVMWFAEEWTEAPAFAPWLAEGRPVQAGPARLVPVDREDGYGWILYVVERPGEPAPPRPPAFGSGDVQGPGWGA